MTKSKSEMKRVAIQKGRPFWHYCYDCQIKAGGRAPKDNPALINIEVLTGICGGCDEDAGLIPNDAFDWPDKKAVFD